VKFIPNFATISSPLWDLTSKAVKWQWRAKESKAFQEIKELLTRAPVMVYNRQGVTTRLTTDAAPAGVVSFFYSCLVILKVLSSLTAASTLKRKCVLKVPMK